MKRDVALLKPCGVRMPEGDDDTEEVHQDEKVRFQKRKRQRSCQKATPSKSALLQTGIRQYLGKIGMTWPVFQKTHSRPGFC